LKDSELRREEDESVGGWSWPEAYGREACGLAERGFALHLPLPCGVSERERQRRT
jgi:hypothetical protein